MEDRIARCLWDELSGVFRFATTQLRSLDGTSTCLKLHLKGSPVFCDDSVLVRVEVIQNTLLQVSDNVPTRLLESTSGQTAVLRMRLNDWYILGQHVHELSAIWTQVCLNADTIILDSTIGPAFLTGRVPLAQHEALRMAEIFCGGFCGWTQAAYCLREGGVNISTRWLLDSDADLVDSVQTSHPEVRTIYGPAAFDEPAVHDQVLFLKADINDGWWHRILTGSSPDIVTASPPCQPWSAAGQQSGLQSPDGVLFLTLASISAVAEFPVVCVEEVQGFCSHPDAKHVLNAWRESGYDLVFQQVKNLSEVSPTHRPRLLLIFLHRKTACNSPGAFQVASWHSAPRPTLSANKCYFKVQPDALLEPCYLSEPVKEMYLDAWYLPPSSNHLDPVKYRVHKIHGRAPCFLAQYHYQHLLSERLLDTKGLLGGLLETSKGVRFYSAPEIATCHGIVCPALFPLPDRITMKILGNAIAVPHAVLSLSHALQAFKGRAKTDPAHFVHIAHKLRIKSDSCALLRIQKGWVLVSLECMAQLLARENLRKEIELGLIRARPVFHRVDIVPPALSEHDILEVFFTEHVNPQEALEAFGFCWKRAVPVLELDRQARVHKVKIQDDPTLRLPACLDKPNKVTRALATLTPQGAVCLDRTAPDIFAQLRWVFRWANDHGCHAVQCLDFYGRQVSAIEQMPALLLVIPCTDDTLFPLPCPCPTQVQAMTVVETDLGLHFRIPNEVATDWWLQWPGHILPNLGWQTTFGRFPPLQGEDFCISLEPALTILRLRRPDIKRWLREILFLGQVDQRCQDETGPCVSVKWQVEGRTISHGLLPDSITLADVEAWWFHASTATGCWPNARLYSGPFPLHTDLTLRDTPVHSLFRKHDKTYLTIMPELRGGHVLATATMQASSCRPLFWLPNMSTELAGACHYQCCSGSASASARGLLHVAFDKLVPFLPNPADPCVPQPLSSGFDFAQDTALSTRSSTNLIYGDLAPRMTACRNGPCPSSLVTFGTLPNTGHQPCPVAGPRPTVFSQSHAFGLHAWCLPNPADLCGPKPLLTLQSSASDEMVSSIPHLALPCVPEITSTALCYVRLETLSARPMVWVLHEGLGLELQVSAYPHVPLPSLPVLSVQLVVGLCTTRRPCAHLHCPVVSSTLQRMHSLTLPTRVHLRTFIRVAGHRDPQYLLPMAKMCSVSLTPTTRVHLNPTRRSLAVAWHCTLFSGWKPHLDVLLFLIGNSSS